MLVPADMIGPQSKLLFQVNKYYGDRVHQRKYTIAKTIREICKVVQDVLKEVEVCVKRYRGFFLWLKIPMCWSQDRVSLSTVSTLLLLLQVQEPRFISSLTEINGRYEGFDVISPTEFEVGSLDCANP